MIENFVLVRGNAANGTPREQTYPPVPPHPFLVSVFSVSLWLIPSGFVHLPSNTRLLFYLHPRRVAPQIFQRVVPALVSGEDVDQHRKIIQNYPLADRKPVHRRRTRVVILPQPLLDRFRDGLDLRLARTRADDVIIREGRDAAQVEHDDVFGFFFGGGERTLAGDVFGVNG